MPKTPDSADRRIRLACRSALIQANTPADPPLHTAVDHRFWRGLRYAVILSTVIYAAVAVVVWMVMV